MLRGFILGATFAIVLFAGAVFAGIALGLVPAGADVRPPGMERWAARLSLGVAIARDTRGVASPVQPTDSNLIDGVHAYANDCAVCHGAADGKPSRLAKGFYIRAPLLAKRGVEDDPESETYWKVRHGLRFTAMPAFGGTLSDDDLWKVTMFLKRMDALPVAVEAEWKKVPSAARATVQ